MIVAVGGDLPDRTQAVVVDAIRAAGLGARLRRLRSIQATVRTSPRRLRAIIRQRAERGVLVCGSGVGRVDRRQQVRRLGAVPRYVSARQGVGDDSMNVLRSARVIDPSLAAELVGMFLRARLLERRRHARPVGEVIGFERA